MLHELYLEIYDQVELSFARMKCCNNTVPSGESQRLAASGFNGDALLGS